MKSVIKSGSGRRRLFSWLMVLGLLFAGSVNCFADYGTKELLDDLGIGSGIAVAGLLAVASLSWRLRKVDRNKLGEDLAKYKQEVDVKFKVESVRNKNSNRTKSEKDQVSSVLKAKKRSDLKGINDYQSHLNELNKKLKYSNIVGDFFSSDADKGNRYRLQFLKYNAFRLSPYSAKLKGESAGSADSSRSHGSRERSEVSSISRRSVSSMPLPGQGSPKSRRNSLHSRN